jgi:hypothetical protein
MSLQNPILLKAISRYEQPGYLLIINPFDTQSELDLSFKILRIFQP